MVLCSVHFATRRVQVNLAAINNSQYAHAMGRLLVLYTQVDQLIMEACAERIASAPSQEAKMGLAKQVGDECRHVAIQKQWMSIFGVDTGPVIGEAALRDLHEHFRGLGWIDFLSDLYLVVEALGSQAVEELVPLADPGTRESLRVPLQDELDHVAFGMAQLTTALARIPADQRRLVVDKMPDRIVRFVSLLSALNLPLDDWFEKVGADYQQLCGVLERRQQELLGALAA